MALIETALKYLCSTRKLLYKFPDDLQAVESRSEETGRSSPDKSSSRTLRIEPTTFANFMGPGQLPFKER